MVRIFLATALLGLAAMGCSNDCDDAVDKLKECNITSDSSESTDDCSGKSECAAKCTSSANCTDLKAFFNELKVDNAYGKCLSAC